MLAILSLERAQGYNEQCRVRSKSASNVNSFFKNKTICTRTKIRLSTKQTLSLKWNMCECNEIKTYLGDILARCRQHLSFITSDLGIWTNLIWLICNRRAHQHIMEILFRLGVLEGV